MIKETTLDFVDAINSHNAYKIVALMADDHAFIDAYGNSAKFPLAMRLEGFFFWQNGAHLAVSWGVLLSEKKPQLCNSPILLLV